MLYRSSIHDTIDLLALSVKLYSQDGVATEGRHMRARREINAGCRISPAGLEGGTIQSAHAGFASNSCLDLSDGVRSPRPSQTNSAYARFH